MTARRDQALAAFDDEDARYDQLDRIEDGAAERRDALLELELTLGLPSPAISPRSGWRFRSGS